MVNVVACPMPILAFLNNQGQPNAGGTLLTQVGSVNFPTYSDSAGTDPLPNPIPLNSRGEVSTANGISSQLFVVPNTIYAFTLFDSGGNQIDSFGYVNGVQLTGEQVAALLNAITDNPALASYDTTVAETLASVTPTNFAYPPLDVRRYGALFNNLHDDTNAINQAISVGTQTVNGSGEVTAQGATFTAPTGIGIISSEITLLNRVIGEGQNKRGTVFQASATWNSGTYPWMFHSNNNLGSAFDSRLESCTVDTNSIAGLGCILSDSWQDGCGLSHAMLINFTTTGVKFQNDPGADICNFEDVEIVSNTSGGGTANCVGVDLSTPLGASAGFKLNMTDSVVLGGGQNLAKAVWVNGNSLSAIRVHIESSNSGFYLDGGGFITLIDCDGSSSSVGDLVTIASTFTGTLIMINCRRNGATNFVNDLRSGGYGAISYDMPLLIINGDTTESAKGLGFLSAWVEFDGTPTGSYPIPMTIINSFNVSSVSKTGVGRYTVTLTRAMQNNGAPWSSGNSVVSGVAYGASVIGKGSFSISVDVSGSPSDAANEVKGFIAGG